jgi:hypothetical protein
MRSIRKLFGSLMRDDQNERAERDVVALPLTHQELLVVIRCLDIASESERTDAADTRTIGFIRERIARFAERQGAWWDMEGVLVATLVKTIYAREVAK